MIRRFALHAWALASVLALFASLLTACGNGPSATSDAETAISRTEASILYGSDSRQEYFEVSDPGARAVAAESMVALIPKSNLNPGGLSLADGLPSWGIVEGLCPGEPFADQPSAAFCSGVLMDWDLVLTAAHCVHVLALSEFVAVFGYYYEPALAPLQFSASDVIDVTEVVSEQLDRVGDDPRLDYAWLRLGRRATPPRRPAQIRVREPALVVGGRITSISSVGGVPIKLDAGGTVRDVRADSSDYFIADTDTFSGSSGAGAFDASLALAGIFARGGTDFVVGDGGCKTTARVADGSVATEQFTYAYRAFEGLCADTALSAACPAVCGSICQNSTATEPTASEGCNASGSRSRPRVELGLALAMLILASTRRTRATFRSSISAN